MPVNIYILAFSLTLLIELPLAAVYKRNIRFFFTAVLVNAITNPAANFLAQTYPHIFFGNEYAIPVMEVIIVLIEWAIYCALFKKEYFRLFLFSILANAASYLSGLIIF